MADRSTADVLGIGTVVLNLTSGKTLTLKDVKHVPTIAKNLVSGGMLCDIGMRLDFQSGKVVLSYKKIYFGSAFHADGMFKISTTVPNLVNNVMCHMSSAQNVDTIDCRKEETRYSPKMWR